MDTTVRVRSNYKPSSVNAGWLPEDSRVRLQWLSELYESVEVSRPLPLRKSIQELKDLIDDSAQLSLLFKAMFEEIPYSHRLNSFGQEYKVVNYEHLLHLFNRILDSPPKYDKDAASAYPFTVLLEWPMATRSGIVAFLHKELNLKLGGILDEWGAYLATPGAGSNKFVTNDLNDKDNWLNKEARSIMKAHDPGKREFEDLYECQPGDPNLGYDCWDTFFTRRFRPKVRPVEDEGDFTITNGCESAPFAIKQKVKSQEKFWIKGHPYSLKHMLDSQSDAEKYDNGTVYQAYLSPLTYHRWHAPINGNISKIRLIKGSYFSAPPTGTFPDPHTFSNIQHQAYLSSVATRALIYIENPVVGEMVMVLVGMVEVSTCEISTDILSRMREEDGVNPTFFLEDGETLVVRREGQSFLVKRRASLTEFAFNNGESVSVRRDGRREGNTTYVPKDGVVISVKKGDELGTFHFGGSTHCFVFGPQVQLNFRYCALPLDANTDDEHFVPLNTVIADVVRKERPLN